MFWQTQNELDALAQFRADRRRNEELHQELMDFTDIFFDSKDPQQKAWAKLMIKSVKHELDQLNA